jgi:TonB family protein
MKLLKILPIVLLAVFLKTSVLQAQSPQLNPLVRQDFQEAYQRFFQRGGGPGQRGTAQTFFAPLNTNPDGAWWTNSATVARLGLSDDQKTRIERAFENHKQDLATRTETLNKDEAQLAKLLDADAMDRNAVFAQIDRVAQDRSELERANSVMTMEMREVLTRAQWEQLHPQQRVRIGANIAITNLIMPVVAPVTSSGPQGSVTLETEIGKEGNVESVRAITGDPTLVQAASDAVKQWHFRPTLLNGLPVAVITNITVTFPFTGVAQPPAAGQRRGGGGRGPQ